MQPLARTSPNPVLSGRRLLTAESPNPTLATVVRLANALGYTLELVRRPTPGTKAQPDSRTCFLFVNARRDTLLLYFVDNDGDQTLLKRADKGSFLLPAPDAAGAQFVRGGPVVSRLGLSTIPTRSVPRSRNRRTGRMRGCALE